MLKRNLEKIFTTAATILAMILIIILLVIAYGGIDAKDLENNLVRGLFITLAIIFGLLATTSLVFIFINDDAIKEITLRTETAQKTRVTVAAVKKMVVKACSEIEGVKCRGIKLSTSDYGVKLKVKVSVKEKDVEQVESYVRNLITDVFDKALGFAFSAIEIEIMKFEPAYKPDVATILAQSDAELQQKKEEKAEQATVDEIIAPLLEETTEDTVEEAVEETPVEEVAETEEATTEVVEEAAEEVPAEETVEVLETETDEQKDEQ